MKSLFKRIGTGVKVTNSSSGVTPSSSGSESSSSISLSETPKTGPIGHRLRTKLSGYGL